MRVERVTTKSRIELLTQIEGFLKTNGWSAVRTDNQTLSAKDALGVTLNFKFIPFNRDPNYGFASRSYIEVESGESKRTLALFRFDDSLVEFSDGFLVGDDKTFVLWIDNQFGLDRYVLLFLSGYITKTHKFNGGYVSFSSMQREYRGGYNWGGYLGVNLNRNKIPFSSDSEFVFTLGGEILPIYNQNLSEIKFLTNLVRPFDDIRSLNYYNALSKLSAQNLLNIGKSNLSGLYVLITPNFYYKNNRNIFVHAGGLDFVRVLKETDRLENGQILHHGSEKFMVLRPNTPSPNFQPNQDNYTMAVRID